MSLGLELTIPPQIVRNGRDSLKSRRMEIYLLIILGEEKTGASDRKAAINHVKLNMLRKMPNCMCQLYKCFVL